MKYSPRKTKPEKGNKYYIRKANGGYSPCIKGNPTDKNCNVLCNCVGYAVGRFNEIADTKKIKYFTSMNAENFYANAYKWNLKTGSTPKLGAIMCWRKGKAGLSSDGAGHVAVVEEIKSNGDVVASNSAYKGSAFYMKTYKKSNKYYLGSKYTFIGFIYNPIEFDNKEKYKGDLPKLPLRGYFKYTYNSKKKEYTQIDKGKQVGNLQKFLNWAVDTKLDVDEKYGIKTGEAVNKFEKLVGLEIDHEFGKKCLAKAKEFEK